jgi:hypothetical protein
MKCTNHPNREATHTDSVPDPNKPGMNLNECGYTRKPFCWECTERRRRDVGGETRIDPIVTKTHIGGEEVPATCSGCKRDGHPHISVNVAMGTMKILHDGCEPTRIDWEDWLGYAVPSEKGKDDPS